MWTKNNFLYEKSVVWEWGLAMSFQQAKMLLYMGLIKKVDEVVNMC